MLAAGHQAQTEARPVQRDEAAHQRDDGQQHEPVELKAADVHKKRLFRVDILYGRGDVVGAFGGVHRLDDDRRGGGAEHVHGGTDDGLIRLEIDAGEAEQRRIYHAEDDRHDDSDDYHHYGGHGFGQELHRQRTAERAHDHDAFKANVDNAGVLRETAAQRDEDKNGSKNKRVLKQKYHYLLPPSLIAPAFSAASSAAFLCALRSSLRSMQLLMKYLKKATKPHR